MKKTKLFSLSSLFILLISIFFNTAKADTILLTSTHSKPFGHTSLISQDKNKKWFYFYWGIKTAYELEVPSEAIENIDNFNKWLYDQKLQDKKVKNTTSLYTHAIYIKGDFSKTTEHYSKCVNNHRPWKYYFVLNFCSSVTKKALKKGTFEDGKSIEDLIKTRKKATDYIPFYDDVPINFHNLVKRSLENTNYEAHKDWGIIKNPDVLKKINMQ